MRSRRYSTISWFSIGVGSMTRRRRASRVTTGRTAFWDHGPRSVVRNRPRGFSSGRHRPIELFPTASKTTSYWWSSFVKSTASRSMTRSVLRDRQELGMRAEPRAVAEHPVSGGEPRHPRADGLDDPRELVAENRRPRPDESGERADEERLR